MRKVVSLCLSIALIILSYSGVCAAPSEKDEILLDIKNLATQGKLLACPFPLGIHIKNVEEGWGKARSVVKAVKPFDTITLYYFNNPTFTCFYVDPNNRVIGIGGSADELIKKVTSSDVKRVLGEPTSKYTNTENTANIDAEQLFYEYGPHVLSFAHAYSKGHQLPTGAGVYTKELINLLKEKGGFKLSFAIKNFTE